MVTPVETKASSSTVAPKDTTLPAINWRKSSNECLPVAPSAEVAPSSKLSPGLSSGSAICPPAMRTSKRTRPCSKSVFLRLSRTLLAKRIVRTPAAGIVASATTVPGLPKLS